MAKDDAITVLQSLDQDLDSLFDPESIFGDVYRIHRLFEQSLEIRTQCAIANLTTYGRRVDTFVILANIFCEDSDYIQQPMAAKDALQSGPYKQPAGLNLTATENKTLKTQYIGRIRNILSRITTKRGLANVWPKLEDEFPFHNFQANIMAWAKESLDAVREETRVREESPGLFVDAHEHETASIESIPGLPTGVPKRG